MKQPRLIIPFILLFFAILVANSLIFSKNKIENNQTLEAEKIYKACQKEFNKDVCYTGEFSKLTSYTNFDKTIQILTQIQEIDPQVRNCHLIAHTIASNETKKDPFKWQDLLSKIDANFCNGGFLHGVIEQKHQSDPSFLLNKDTIPQICQTVKDINQAEEATCIHIMGHLILLDTQGNLPNALDSCLQLPLEH